MDENDPRHGTNAGEIKHRRDGEKPCEPCRKANVAYQRRVRVVYGRSPRHLRDATGSRRRIQALFALGWSGTHIAATSGVGQRYLGQIFKHDSIERSTAERIAAVYESLSMRIPPTDTKSQRISVAKSRGLAKRRGWAPPLAWDNIDDPECVPAGRHEPRKPTSVLIQDEFDSAVVERILAGDYKLTASAAEKREVIRRWKGSHNDLGRLTGWRIERYLDRDGDAA